MQLYAAYTPGATFGGTGLLTAVRTTENGLASLIFPARNTVPLPAGFNGTQRRAWHVRYGGRLYVFDWGTDNLVYDEHHRAGRLGIRPAATVPTIAAVAGGAITGACIPRTAFWDGRADVWSPLSGAGASVNLVAQARSWTNIPVSDDPRVSHVGLFVSVDGESTRLATKVTNGTTAASEGVPTLSLGDTLEGFEVFPRVPIAAVYHDRLFVAGLRDPSKLWLSHIGRPERRDTSIEFTTRSGEAITALIPVRDALLVMCANRCEILRGYTNRDLVLDTLDDAIGCFSQHAWAIAQEYVIVVNRDGIFMWNGAWHRINADDENEFQRIYGLYPTHFEAGFAALDQNDKTFQFYISNLLSGGGVVPTDWNIPAYPDVTTSVWPETIAYTTSYSDLLPEQGGGFTQPLWNLDLMRRTVECGGLIRESGNQYGRLALGHCDGYTRKKGKSGDTGYANDDEDLYLKTGWIRMAPIYGSDPGGGFWEGKQWKRLIVFVRSDLSAWDVFCKGGDEEAYKHLLPTNAANDPSQFFVKHVTASALLSQAPPSGAAWAGPVDYAAKSVHDIASMEGVSGRALTLEFRFPSADTLDWRGVLVQYSLNGNPFRGVVANLEGA